MEFRAIIASVMMGAVVLGPAPASSATREPLIITPLPDPDPDFIPEKTPASTELREASESPNLDQAMQDFGRAIGQAALIQQQAIEARCRAGEPAGGSAADRFTWAASCRYQRH